MSWFSELINKLSHLRNRNRFDEGIEEEIRLHMEARVEELIATGVPRADAFATARREFGSSARLVEESRDAWRWGWLEDLVKDLRYAARALRRDRAFAAAAVLSLALGIGVNTTLFSLTTEFLFSEPSVRDLNTLLYAQIGGEMHVPSMREYKFLRDAKIFDGLAGTFEMQEINWRTSEASVRLFVTRVTENFFDVTGAPLGMGRPIQAGERNTAVISHRFWQSRLNGDPNVLGRSLVLDGQPYIVVGVLPTVHRTLVGFGYAPDLYLPLWNESTGVSLYGRLPSGITRQAMLGRLTSAAVELDKVYPDGNHKWSKEVSLMKLNGMDRLSKGFLPSIWTMFAALMGIVGLLLLIACGNVASLLLARGSARQQEFAIRMSIGAGRGRLVRQMLAESLLLASLGTGVGLAMNYLLSRLMNTLVFSLPFPLRLAIQPDWRLLLYAALLAVISAVFAGLLPALKSTRTGANSLIKRDEHQVSGHRATLRNILVTGQLAVSVLLLITAALSIRNLVQSTSLNPGFDIQHTAWAQVRLVPENYPTAPKIRAMALSTLERLNTLPGVTAASIASFVPLNDHFLSRSLTVYSDTTREGSRIEHSWNAVGPNYFKTLNIGIVAGREFQALDREGTQRVLIVNKSFAQRVFGATNPLGRRIRFGRDTYERVIVGVAKNSKYSTVGEENRPAVYEAYLQVGGRPTMQFLARADGPGDSLMRPLNAALMNMDATAAVEIKPMVLATAFALLPSQIGATLLGTIGVLGLLLASVGLYGVLAYSISRRTREIGLRVALGARRGQVVRLVMREAGWILSYGLVIGMLLAVFVTKPLARFLVPGLKATDPVTYFAVAIVLAAVGCAASLTPALRALRIDPMAALRYE